MLGIVPQILTDVHQCCACTRFLHLLLLLLLLGIPLGTVVGMHQCREKKKRREEKTAPFGISSMSSPGPMLGILPGILVGMRQEEQCASLAPAGGWILDQDRNFWPPSDKSYNLGP